MELILFAMITLVVIVALLANRLNDNSFPFPFDRKDTIFTPAEKNFQHLLEQAVGSKYRVLNRVKLSDIVTIRRGVSKRASQTAIANANNKFLDFVVCERDSMKLLGAIDLVDTQGRGYKLKKDWFVSGSLEAAAIPHIRIKIKNAYSVEEIRACVNTRLLKEAPTAPKMPGKVIPAPMVKARNKQQVGVVTPKAALAHNTTKAARMPAPNVAALPH